MEKEARKILPLGMRRDLHGMRHLLDRDLSRRLGLYVSCPTYLQDPTVARRDPELGVVSTRVRWEPGFAAGPTSSRIQVVDTDPETREAVPPVAWDSKLHAFVGTNGEAIEDDDGTPQFRQLNAWAVVQSILEYYEHPRALGRPIPWAFEGHRLLLVPQAGKEANAYYDRHSRSMSFFFYGETPKRRYTCLSRDVVAHETGHALLDGIRPAYYHLTSPQTAAFHEFVADLTAILTGLRDNELRRRVGERVGADLVRDQVISGLGEELGEFVHGTRGASLRSARNDFTLADFHPEDSPHRGSQILTGAMFEILCGVAAEEAGRRRRSGGKNSAAQALWVATDTFGRMALQALDLCPPVDIQFLDYARAVLRNDVLVNPVASASHRRHIFEVFHRRGFCSRAGCRLEDASLGRCDLRFDAGADLPALEAPQDFAGVIGSRTGAYYFLDHHREALRIPVHRDLHVADLYRTRKMGLNQDRLPEEVVLLYTWQEPVLLDEARFAEVRGRRVNLLCGGTLVFDGRGNLRSWMRKPGTEVRPCPGMSSKQKRLAKEELEQGRVRREALKDHVALQVELGSFAFVEGPDRSTESARPVVAWIEEETLHLERVPHLRDVDASVQGSISGDET